MDRCKSKKLIESVAVTMLVAVATYFVLYNQTYFTSSSMIDSNIDNSFTDANKSFCRNPTYIMWQYTSRISMNIPSSFEKYGFNLNCSLNEIRSSYQKLFASNNAFKHFTCQKYNHQSMNYSTHFCNGGRIYFLCDRKNRHNKPRLTPTLDRYGIHTVTKVSLHKILTIYCNTFHVNDNVCNFNLLTYQMNNDQQRIKFLTNHIDCTKSQSESTKTWVFKENKDQGKGVHFVNNDQLIYKLIAPNKTEQTMYYNQCGNIHPFRHTRYLRREGFWISKLNNGKGFQVNSEGLLIQEFISNGLLINSRRFHVRAWLLVVWSPLIVLYYPQGFIFINPEKYDGSTVDKMVLRTNAHVGHVSKSFKNGAFHDIDMFWSYTQFQQYLNKVYGDELFNYTTNKLQNDILHIAKHTFKANTYYNEINGWKYNQTRDQFNGNIDVTFHILCMDIAITDTFELKLMELNSHCGVEAACTLNPSECEEFASDSADVLLEVYKKRHDNITITSIDNPGRFQIAFMQQ